METREITSKEDFIARQNEQYFEDVMDKDTIKIHAYRKDLMDKIFDRYKGLGYQPIGGIKFDVNDPEKLVAYFKKK